MSETFSREVAKEFVLRRLRLTPNEVGKSKKDVPSVVHVIGGLQHGGHKIELFNRFKNFKSEWFNYWYNRHAFIEGHVLRGALRIVTIRDYPYYFKATRSVARRRSYQKCPSSLSSSHLTALNFIDEHGPFTPSEFEEMFGARYPHFKDKVGKLLYDLYNYGKIARMGRRNQKPLYHAIQKLPYKLDIAQVTEKEAKKWLFLKSLSTYGPFTLRDIAHWVGWNITETKEILKVLLKEKKIVNVKIEKQQDTHHIRVEDMSFLSRLRNDLPEHSFIRILFNDDALLLGYYRRLEDYFGYCWKYPQLSQGIIWRAAILYGRNLIGDAIVDMYTKSRFFKVKELVLRKEFAVSEIFSKIEEEFVRHAKFQNKNLKLAKPHLI